MNSLIELFCHVDDWCQANEAQINHYLLPYQGQKSKRDCRLSMSEIMTLMVHFHQSHHRNFKHYYLSDVQLHLTSYFPNLVSYTRFVELMKSALMPLCGYLKSRFGQVTGISFIDSTKLAVCENIRIMRHLVFKEIAERGKTSVGWFYGFKLHLVINHEGELLNVKITTGNTDDRKPVPNLVKSLFGKVFGDRGYVSQNLVSQLHEKGVELITNVRKNMKLRLISLFDRLLLRKRFLIETVIDQLKNISQIEHSRHRSIWNFAVNLISGLIAYTHQPKKPSLNLKRQELRLLSSI